MTNVNFRQNLSVKVKTIYAVIAVAAAVALPQLLHVLGAASGIGSSLGEVFLPMHLPVMLVGLIAGPVAGAISGAFSPLISFMLTGMPSAALLPFMMIELVVYGLSAGLLNNIKMPAILKVIIIQISGRAVRAAAILIAFYTFGATAISPTIILKSISAGLIGIALQWAFIPLIIFRVKNSE